MGKLVKCIDGQAFAHVKLGEVCEVIEETGGRYALSGREAYGLVYRKDAFEVVQEVVKEVLKEVLPPAETLARAIFNTDERVKKDISKYAGECDCLFCREWGVSPTSIVCSPVGPACREMAPYFDKAWDSNRNNWRTEAEAKAAGLLAELTRLGK